MTKQKVLWVARIAILIVVSYFLFRAVRDAQTQLAEYRFSFASAKMIWLVVAGGIYLMGLLPMGMYWHFLLRSMHQSPRLGETLGAYYAGHLGKYVPGKAMVVVIRTGMVKSDRVQTTVAAVSVFAETLAMMSVGAFLAALLMATWFSGQTLFLVISVVLMLVAGAPTWPPVFRWLIKTFKLKSLDSTIRDALQGYTWKVVMIGWAANLLGWISLAISLCMVLYAISPEAQMSSMIQYFGRAVASVCLATVAGFLSLLPGGILIRELVIEELLAPKVGKALAIISAVLLRLVWLFAELIIAAILHMARKK